MRAGSTPPFGLRMKASTGVHRVIPSTAVGTCSKATNEVLKASEYAGDPRDHRAALAVILGPLKVPTEFHSRRRNLVNRKLVLINTGSLIHHCPLYFGGRDPPTTKVAFQYHLGTSRAVLGPDDAPTRSHARGTVAAPTPPLFVSTHLFRATPVLTVTPPPDSVSGLLALQLHLVSPV